ncbi:MAG: cas3 [Rhodocyclaceae bacterium]|nr:cas3 [Rhodocyclaceae bacterium]
MADHQVLNALFAGLFDSPPNRWQREAFDAFCENRLPRYIKVPTAGGKTAILAVFLAALATQARAGMVTLPRRLVLVVNRRVLVDQATGLAERLLRQLSSDTFPAVTEALKSISPRRVPLAVSTLRGALADNGEWSLDPATPAIVLGTPDMIGSRLLFRGYGTGRSRAATHAGLLGIDTLVVHDEAHLAPTFSALLHEIETLARPSAEAVGRAPLHVLEMTATLDSQCAPGSVLSCNVADDPLLSKRMQAPKTLAMVDLAGELPKGKPAAHILNEIAKRAIAYADASKAVAIFVHRPEAAGLLADRLAQASIPPERIAILTGTLRGWERERLLDSAAFRRFLPSRPENASPEPTAYLICTSAGEIGLDIDADVGLMDLVTLDRIIQRAGRINRRGLGTGRLFLVHAQGNEIDGSLRAPSQVTLELLTTQPEGEFGLDASPLALSLLIEQPRYAAAIPPPPPRRSLEPGIVAQWAMTTLCLDALRVPAPDLFLQALDEEDRDVDLIWRVFPHDEACLADWFDAWPVLRHERARLPVFKARALLEALWPRALQHAGHDIAVAILDSQGRLEAGGAFAGYADLRTLMRSAIPGKTLVIRNDLGGLTGAGLPDGNCHEPVADVSTQMRGQVITLDYGVDLMTGECSWSDGEHVAPRLPALIEAYHPGHEIVFSEEAELPPADLLGQESARRQVLVWLQRHDIVDPDAGDAASHARCDRMLDEHLELARKAALAILDCLALPAPLSTSIEAASARHDLGKRYKRWQAALGNPNPDRPLAKSRRPFFDQHLNDGYRHELGSVLEVGEGIDELESHLIAAHHGWARPGFSSKSRQHPGCQEAADRVAVSFARLNERFGPWGLAYLEAVVKSADILAELDADRLSRRPIPEHLPVTRPAVSSAPISAVDIPADPRNFGEYLACLGLLGVLSLAKHGLNAAWSTGAFRIEGATEADILNAVDQVVDFQIAVDERALLPELKEAKFPPLRITFGKTGCTLALNNWLAPGFSGKSEWKLSAGQTEATKILSGLCIAARQLRPRLTAPALIFQLGTTMKERFRFDAGTSWSALDAGFTLNEDERFSTARVFLEIFSILGLQHVFPPPGDREPFRYFTWTQPLPAALCLAAAKGLLPLPTRGWTPRRVPSGQMKDIFTSELTFSSEESTWLPKHLIL